MDDSILLEFIKDILGIEDTAREWFASYLTGHTQHFSVENTVSELADLLYGVPRGSVMGPIKYSIYTLPMEAIIRSHGLSYSIYADGMQVYLSFNLKTSSTAPQKLNYCLLDIQSWMLKNKLKINDDKTEFLILGIPILGVKTVK